MGINSSIFTTFKMEYLFIYLSVLGLSWTSLVAQMVKNLPAMQETCVWSLGLEDPLEKEMTTHSSILSGRTPWTEEPGRPPEFRGLQTVGHDWVLVTACGIRSPNRGWIPAPALAAESLSHWTTREVPATYFTLSSAHCFLLHTSVCKFCPPSDSGG